MPEIVNPQIADPSSTTGSPKSRPDTLDRLFFIQEHSIGVQAPLFP
jgi:hypothetical protein